MLSVEISPPGSNVPEWGENGHGDPQLRRLPSGLAAQERTVGFRPGPAASLSATRDIQTDVSVR